MKMMMMLKSRSQSSILLWLVMVVVVFALLDSSSAAGRTALVGDWRPIKDVNETHVQEIAQFAVGEHNKEYKTELKYDRVVQGETQVVAGANYRLIIAAKDGVVSNNYQAVVYERPWEGFKNLTSFKQL
ncbi:cysteine proteinase inhibitor 1 [Telopea speciosissima]|uniref:cysteine proteinase inhibitor 1 n=1 Tax=Telopea speciosissima TaxID=54955 RepID=UPI001CC6F8DB|nr:cysteine proteinase inhibitor 1 [Telopea speciosissima]